MRPHAVVLTLVLTLASTPAFAQSTATTAATPVKQIDSLWNGALIGLGAGAAAAWIFTRVNCGPKGYDSECAVIATAAGAAVFVPAGVIAGAIIDRLINKTLPPGAKGHVSLTPMLSEKGGRRAIGAALSMRLRF